MLGYSLGSNQILLLFERRYWYLLFSCSGDLLRHTIFISECVDRGRLMLWSHNWRLSCLGWLTINWVGKTLVERNLIQGEVIDIVLALRQGRLLRLRCLNLWGLLQRLL